MIATGQDAGALELIRRDYGARWDILHTTAKWYALRRDPGHTLQRVSATTARGLLHDLERIEEATG